MSNEEQQKWKSQKDRKKKYKEHRIPHEKFIHLKFSEYSMPGKHDDLTPPERKILVQMERGDRHYWQLNHFRNIREFNNDGDAISEALSSLAIKHYIKRVSVGPKTRRKTIRDLPEDQAQQIRKSNTKWVLDR